jgi:hypothetical protein
MPELSPQVRVATRLHTDALLRRRNVIAVGAGIRRKAGSSTGEPAVVVYVSRKLPPEALNPDELIPRRIVADDVEVRTDVVEVGEPRFVAVDTASYRPIRGGCQIGNARGAAGTAGAVMYDRRDQRIVLLTNNHVLMDPADRTNLPANTTMFQPAGGPRIGQSKRVVPMFLAPLGAYDYRWYASVDAGIVGLDSNVPAEFDVIEVGPHPYVLIPPYPGLEVVRRGYRTQYRVGTVESVDMTVIVKASNGDRCKIGGPDCVFTIRSREREVSAMPGDSGSLVVDADGGASRGLVFASDEISGGITWACELGTVMSLLELDTPCTGSLNALIRRSVFIRLADRWSLAQEVAGVGGTSNVLVTEQIETMKRFRHGYLGTEAEGTVGQTVGAALHRLAPALATAITNDDDAAGLLERAFGEWLLQPTVFDLLEYRFSDQASGMMSHAFRRLQQLGANASDLEEVVGLFLRAGGRSVRELVTNRASAEHRRRHGEAHQRLQKAVTKSRRRK